LKRSRLVAVLVALGLAAALAFAGPRLHAQSRPNIILLMVDDLSVDILKTMIDKGMMPNVKSYVTDQSNEFVQSFVTRSLGTPSRATSLNGLYAHNHGVLGHLNETNGGISRFNATSTIATWLKAGGYRTGYIGKYLSGYGTWTSPTYVPPGWDDWTVTLEPNNHSMDNYKVNRNGTVTDYGPYYQQYGDVFHQMNILTLQSSLFVRTAPLYLRPFFLYLAPPAINMEIPFYNECPNTTAVFWGGNFWGATARSPVRYFNSIFGNASDFSLPLAPSFNELDTTDKPDWVQTNPMLTADDADCLQKNYWRRLESLRAFDDMVGYLVQALQSTGAWSNTVIMLTSDNGLYLGEHRLGEKSSAYEESIRVPLYIRMPGMTAPRQIHHLVLNNDLAPTIASLAGVVPWQTPDGRSLLPLMQNPNTTAWRKAFLVEHWSEVDLPTTTAPTLFALRSGAATRPRLFVRYPDVPSGISSELYDLIVDPFEMTNMAGDPARAAEALRMEQFLNALKTCRGLTCTILESIFTFD
jgi:arylsulfatase A-like enzyme